MPNFKTKNVFQLIFIFTIIFQKILCDLVILNLRDDNTKNENEIKKICAIKKEIRSNDYNIKYKIVDLTPYSGCVPFDNPTQNISNKATFLSFNSPLQCSLGDIIKNLEANQATLAIIGSDGPIKTNLTNTNVTISPVFMPSKFSNILSNYLKNSVGNPTVELTTTKEKFDYSLIIIWFIAVISVFFGSLWAGYEYIQSIKSKSAESCVLNDETANNNDSTRNTNNNNTNTNLTINDENINNNNNDLNKKSKSNDEDDSALLNVGYLGVLVLLIFVITILLLIYFFYNYMIYFIYVIFVIGATMSMFRIICLFFDKSSYFKCRVPKNNLPILKHQPQIAHIIISILLFGLSITWFVFRKESWGWILQNILALSLAINALSFYRLSSYKMVTIILVLFCLYDVFMVFITPLFTGSKSIMEAVAFGGRDNAKENKNELNFNTTSNDINRLPVVIIIPRLSKITQLCSYYLEYPFSLLGLGDLLIPGLSVNYAILFDIATRNRVKIYFIANLFAYGLGLFLAFIGLIFMGIAQPALFYLCPTHLIITFLVAIIRKEVKMFWSGESVGAYSMSTNTENTKSIRSESLENIVE